MENRKYIYIKEKSFDNIKGGIILARDFLKEIMKISKPFLEKHIEYKEVYTISIGEFTTKLIYEIYKINE